VCSACNAQGCGQDKKSTRITFSEQTLNPESVKIESSSLVNGAKNQTLSVSVTLGNPLLPRGSFTLKMPKRNYWFWFQGAATRDCLIEECDYQRMQVTAKYANSSSAKQEI
jgi:hypothetical protein